MIFGGISRGSSYGEDGGLMIDDHGDLNIIYQRCNSCKWINNGWLMIIGLVGGNALGYNAGTVGRENQT